jgi:hypothetical protein
MQDGTHTTPDRFDRMLGSLVGLPDVLNTPPSTVRTFMPLIGQAQTFIVQTFRQKEVGDTIFVEYVDDRGTVRLVIPPQAAKVIRRQYDALTDRSRSRAARAVADERKRLGVQPAFLKGKKAKKK